jgi:small-conductance mechanosensitive channel
VGVSYGDDLEKVRQITLDAVSGIEELSQEDPVKFFLLNLVTVQ